MRVYIAGPYTSDPPQNTRKAMWVANTLMEMGHEPYCPHLTMFQDMVYPRPYEDWLKIDLSFLSVCDAVYRILGDSSGADREVAKAQELGIPVFHTLGDLK